MTELVLAIQRSQLNLPSNANGVFDVDLNTVDPHAYALLPRHIADNKSEESIQLGRLYPQILAYVQFVNQEGKYLTYARKGKEKGLHGLRSIGIGGHVSHDDFEDSHSNYLEGLPNLLEIIQYGYIRELFEETGFQSTPQPLFYKLVVSNANPTSEVHVGLLRTIHIKSPTILTLADDEFLDVQWLTADELKANIEQYEPWSQEIIKSW